MNIDIEVGTSSEWVACPVRLVAKIMGHKPSASAEKNYRRHPLDQLRSWHLKILFELAPALGISIADFMSMMDRLDLSKPRWSN